MKKIAALVLCVSAALAAGAQLPVGMDPPFPPSLGGTMMPIRLPEEFPAAPDSLTPVFVNHIGRHGARFLSSEKKVGDLLSSLEAARTRGSLTRAGEEMAALLQTVREKTDGRWGQLDSLGEAEQRGIASRLDAMLPGFFSQGSIIAISTFVPRAVASMYGFCHQLGSLNPALQMTASSGREYDSLLRFFDTDRRYADYIRHGGWRKTYDGYSAANVPVAPAIRLVGGGRPKEELQDITMRVYAVLQSLPAAGINAGISRFMTPEEYRACYLADNLKHALQRTDTRFSDLPGKAAEGLLREIIDSSEVIVGTAEARRLIRGVFRFAHAETLMPLFSLMGLPGCTVPQDATPQTLADCWNDSFVSPLGANLILVFYAAPSGKAYVQALLNGRQIAPLPAAASPIVPWTSLRDFWQKSMLP